MTLRGYLSTIAGLSLLATTVYFLAADIERAMKKMEEEDKLKAARQAERDAAAAAAVTAAKAPMPVLAGQQRKGWW
jgi:Na+-transporting methylmalonyl-CoA/oxaloacetate decarboxylase gamma subunit